MSQHLEPPAFKFRLSGQIPSGKNAVVVTRTGHRYPNERFKKWREASLFRMKVDAYVSPAYEDHSVPMDVVVLYTPKDRRRRDVPGMIDALWHLMEKFGLVDDDCQFKGVAWDEAPPDKEASGVVVTAWNREVGDEVPKEADSD